MLAVTVFPWPNADPRAVRVPFTWVPCGRVYVVCSPYGPHVGVAPSWFNCWHKAGLPGLAAYCAISGWDDGVALPRAQDRLRATDITGADANVTSPAAPAATASPDNPGPAWDSDVSPAYPSINGDDGLMQKVQVMRGKEVTESIFTRHR